MLNKREVMTDHQLQALKIAFTYMPQAIEVTRYEYGDRCAVILEHIATVREALQESGIDPDEVGGEINPDLSPNSYY
jgi:hypothetical protein